MRIAHVTQTAAIGSKFGKLGLSVCYDLRFPELFRDLARQGMDILCLPAAFKYHSSFSLLVSLTRPCTHAHTHSPC
jgi:predicted amidohydrolase